MSAGTMARRRRNGLDGGAAQPDCSTTALRRDDRARAPFREWPVSADTRARLRRSGLGSDTAKPDCSAMLRHWDDHSRTFFHGWPTSVGTSARRRCSGLARDTARPNCSPKLRPEDHHGPALVRKWPLTAARSERRRNIDPRGRVLWLFFLARLPHRPAVLANLKHCRKAISPQKQRRIPASGALACFLPRTAIPRMRQFRRRNRAIYGDAMIARKIDLCGTKARRC